MSRIGKAPIDVPNGVEVKLDGNILNVKGPNGNLIQEIDTENITVEVKDGILSFSRSSDIADVRAKHGLYRALAANMITGVSEGYKKELEIIGVGYRVESTGQILTLTVGYSHPIVFEIPEEVKVVSETVKGKPPVVRLSSYDKQLLGQVASKIRSFRKPEPYKGKGIRIKGEYIRRKAGKAAGK